MRLASSYWIDALFKKVRAKGGFCTVLHSGDEQAGAIFVVERQREGTNCWAPVPQAMLSDQDGGRERLFECVEEGCDDRAVSAFIERQLRFDRDCHIIEIDGVAAELPTPAESRRQQIEAELESRFGDLFKKR